MSDLVQTIDISINRLLSLRVVWSLLQDRSQRQMSGDEILICFCLHRNIALTDPGNSHNLQAKSFLLNSLSACGSGANAHLCLVLQLLLRLALAAGFSRDLPGGCVGGRDQLRLVQHFVLGGVQLSEHLVVIVSVLVRIVLRRRLCVSIQQ